MGQNQFERSNLEIRTEKWIVPKEGMTQGGEGGGVWGRQHSGIIISLRVCQASR